MLIYKKLFVPPNSDWKLGNVGTRVTVFAKTCSGMGAKFRSTGYRCCDECEKLRQKKRHNKVRQTIGDRSKKAKDAELALKRQKYGLAAQGECIESFEFILS